MLQLDPEGGAASLTLDAAAVRCRLGLRDDYGILSSGISLGFDAEGHLVRLDFEDARRELPDAVRRGEPPVVEFEPADHRDCGMGQAYLYLEPDRARRPRRSVAIDDKRTRATGDVVLDLDRRGCLLGIEFLDARDVPPSLLADARRV